MCGNWSMMICVMLCVFKMVWLDLEPRDTLMDLTKAPTPHIRTRTATPVTQVVLNCSLSYALPASLPPTHLISSSFVSLYSPVPSSSSSSTTTTTTTTTTKSFISKSPIKPSLDGTAGLITRPFLLSTSSQRFISTLATPQLTKEPNNATSPSGAKPSSWTLTRRDPGAGRTHPQHSLPPQTSRGTYAQQWNTTWKKLLCVQQPDRCASPAGDPHHYHSTRNHFTFFPDVGPESLKLKPLGNLLARSPSTALTEQNTKLSKSPQFVNTETSPSTSWNINCSEATYLITCQEDTSFHQNDTSFHQNPQGCGNHITPQCNSSDVDLENSWKLESATPHIPELKNSWNLENSSSLVPDILINSWNLENASSSLPDLLKNSRNLENVPSPLPDLLMNSWNLENALFLVPGLLENSSWDLENTSSLLPDLLENSWNLENASSLLPDENTRRHNLSFSPCLAQANTSASEEPVSGCSQKTAFGPPSGTPLVATEWARIAGYSLIFLVGVVGNVLVVVTLLHHRNLRTVTNVFLLNLAVSDLLLGVFCMPFTLVGSLLQDFVFGALMCRLIPYIQAVSVSVSVWTLVAISLERFYAICQPLRSRGWQTPAHSYKVIAGVWAASLSVMTPIATLSTLMPVKGDQGRHKCREVWPSLFLERIFTILLTATLLLVPLLVMAAAYLKVIRTLWLGAKIHRTGHMAQLGSSQMSDLRNCSTSNTLPTPSNSRISTRFPKVPTISSEVANPRYGAHYPAGGKEPALSLLQNSRQHCEDTSFNGDLENRLTSSLETHGSAFGSRGDPLPKGRRITKEKRWRNEDKGACGLLRSSHTERSLQAKKRVIRMLFVLVAEFFICWTPLFIVNLLSLYIPRQVYAVLGSFGVSLVQLLAYLSSCCNPITYCFMNANFIQSFKQAFGCPRRRSRSSRSGYESSFKSGAFCQVPLRVTADRSETPNPRSQQSCPFFRTSTAHHTPFHQSLTCVRSDLGKVSSNDTLPVNEAVASSF